MSPLQQTTTHRASTPTRTRRSCRRAYFEALEARTLLTTTFSYADVAGTWALVGMHEAGSVVADDAGHISGTIRDSDDTQHAIDAGSVYELWSDGEFACHINVDSMGLPINGQMNTRKDLIALCSELTDDSPILIKHTLGNFANADFAGTWSFTAFTDGGDTSRGTLRTDALGHILGGSVTSSEGGTIALRSGTYTVTAEGLVSVNIPVDIDTLHFTGAINNSKDFVGLNTTDFTWSSNPDDAFPATLFLQKTGGTYSNADLSGLYYVADALTWGFSDDGALAFDGAGHIVADDSYFADGVSGTYNVSPSGQVTINLTLDYFGDIEIHRLTGAMNASRSLVTLAGAVTYPDHPNWGRDFDLLVIVPDNRAPTMTTVNTLAKTAIAGKPLAITWDDLAAAANEKDPDGDTVGFAVTSAGGDGALALNGVPVSTFPVVVGPADTLTWTPKVGTKGVTSAFSMKASDGVALSAKALPVRIKTVPPPTINVTFAGRPSEANNDTNVGRFILTRVDGDIASALEVHFQIGGEATPGVDHNLPEFGTAVFAPGKTTVTVSLIAVEDDLAEGTERVSLDLDGDPDYVIGAHMDADLYILDNEPVVSIVASKPKAAELNGTGSGMGVFTLLRTGGNIKQALTVNYSFKGTTAEIGQDTGPLTGTVTFEPNKTTATVRICPVDDYVCDGGECVTLTLDPCAQYSCKGGKDSATVTIADHNRPIIVDTVDTQPGPPVTTTVSFSTVELVAAASLVDPEGAAISFKVKALTKGTLFVNGVKAIIGTIIHAGDALTWTAPSTPGTAQAFTLTATDGVNTTGLLKYSFAVTL